MGLESAFSSRGNVVLGTLDRVVQGFVSWSRRRALAPLVVTGGCCGDAALREIGAALGVPARGLGASSPRDADLLVLAGPLSRKAASALARVYAQIPEPKWVMTVGSCVFDGGAADHAGIDPATIVPVHVRVPGCPPSAAAIRSGLDLLDRLVREERLDARERPRRNTTGAFRIASPAAPEESR